MRVTDRWQEDSHNFHTDIKIENAKEKFFSHFFSHSQAVFLTKLKGETERKNSYEIFSQVYNFMAMLILDLKKQFEDFCLWQIICFILSKFYDF